MPSRLRSFHRCIASCFSARVARHETASDAEVTSSSRGRVDSRFGSGRRTTRSGLRARVAPSSRLVPSSMLSRWADSGDSRNASTSVVWRCGPVSMLRSCSSPRSGSGDADSQSSISGSICCISRLDRLRPRVSSRTAAWVRLASVNPNACMRATAASGLRAPSPAANASSSGRKYTRCWIDRTPRRRRRRSVSSCSAAVPRVVSRYPSTRAMCSTASGSVGMVWTCCSSTSCSRCSTVRSIR